MCLLKGRRSYALAGMGASMLLAALVFEAREVDSGMLEGALLVAFFVMFALPLLILVVVGASRPAKQSSWWVSRRMPAE